MSTRVKNCRKSLVIACAVLLVAVSVLALNLTKPYAVYADGSKVEEPYVVKAGNDELFLVENGETAENVIEAVLDEYRPEGAQINSITVDRKLTADIKDLKRGEEPPVVLTEEEAVQYVLEQNSTDEPLFSVTINADIGSVEAVEAGTSYEESDDLYKGQSKVKTKGSDGDQIVTNEVTSVNGKVLTSQVTDTALVNEAVDTVIYKGTKEKPKEEPVATAAKAKYGGKAMGSGNGAAVANYALQFVGNPYRYGGTSLTNGADCSGFIQSVYAKFGISLPRTGDAQACCGKGVSYSEAVAGDIIYYSGHVAMYIGGGKIVHAADERQGIIVSSADICGPILAVRRIIE